MICSKSQSPPQPPPLFTKDASTIVPHVKRLIIQSRKVQEHILATVTRETATFANVILPLAHNQNFVSRELPVLGFYEAVSTDPGLSEASTQAKKLHADFEIETKTHEGLFELVDAVAKKSEFLEPEDQRLLERYRRDYLRNGLGIPPENRDRFKDIQKQLFKLTSEFEKNLREEKAGLWFTLEELAGVPADLISSLDKGTDGNEGKVLLTFSFPQLFGVLKYATNSETRRIYYTGSENKCSANIPLFKEIMILRQEAAELLGYANHAAFRIEEKMAKTPETVMNFLDDLNSRLSAGAKRDVDGLKELKRQDLAERGEDQDDKFWLWDYAYYQRMMLETQFSVDRKAIAEFFPLETTVSGVMDIFSHLFGLRFEELTTDDRDTPSPTGIAKDLTWHEGVLLFAVWNDESLGSGFLGYLYLDLHPRPGKYGGMCNINLQCGFTSETRQRNYPATALLCNFSPATSTKPSLLMHEEVVLLFHELGHGIHDLVAHTKWSIFHGTATVDDFCEAPSQMLEFWAWDPEVLSKLSYHWSHLSPTHLQKWQNQNPGKAQSDKHLSSNMIDALVKSKNVNGALYQTRLLHRSFFDMTVHSTTSVLEVREMDMAEQWNRLHTSMSFLDTPEGFDWGHGYAKFDALVRVYDAGFYGYL
ncbi:metallopeptidase MepB [Aureobasidium pullulans]|uniref:Metallopeptidase MepB n=1 Tax=Aureobasidium pullulans TaxID=5580 RepID=A0A4S9K8T7_AURPU|nr:metallopeptidase MepB [Aureobasidium pullulans]